MVPRLSSVGIVGASFFGAGDPNFEVVMLECLYDSWPVLPVAFFEEGFVPRANDEVRLVEVGCCFKTRLNEVGDMPVAIIYWLYDCGCWEQLSEPLVKCLIGNVPVAIMLVRLRNRVVIVVEKACGGGVQRLVASWTADDLVRGVEIVDIPHMLKYKKTKLTVERTHYVQVPH